MSGPRVFASRPVEDELFARLEAQRARRAAARGQVSLELAERATAIRDQARWIPASVAVAMAQSGIGPGHPDFDKLSTAAAKSKSKKGLGWHSIGSVVKAAGNVGDFAFGGIDEAVTPFAKSAVRHTAVGALSLYEEAQGVVRNVAAISPEAAGAAVGAGLGSIVPGVGTAIGAGVGGALGAGLGHLARDEVEGEARWEPQSSGAIALENRLRGDRVELGSGWLPNVNADDNEDGETIGAEQRERARGVTVAGRSLTPGRLLAAGVVEPGSQPYNVLSGLVDATVALSRFDPAAAGLKVTGNVNRNRKLFVEAGGLFSSRPAIVPEVADAWWTGATDLRRTLTDLTGDDGFYEIWKATKGKLGAETTHRIAKATTDAEVDEIIRPLLGTHNALRGPLRENFGTFRPFDNVRLTKIMPGHSIDVRDADQSVRTIESWLQNAKASQEVIAKHTAAMAAASTRVGRFEVTKAAMDATKDVLLERGWSEDMASTLTRMVDEATEDTRGYWVNATADNVTVPGMFVDEQVGLPKPHAFSEFVNRAIPLPDARDVRAATSMFAGLIKGEAGWKARDLGVSTLDFVQGNVWKKAALLRGAYTVRVVGEEQLRMAASGLDSLVSHPLSLIAMRLSEDSVIGRAVAKAGGKVGKAGTDALEDGFRYADDVEFVDGLDEYNRSLNRQWAGWVDEKQRNLPIWRKYTPDHAGYRKAWAGEVNKLALDPPHREAARALLDGRGLDDLKASFWDGQMSSYRKTMAEEATGLRTREVADRYVDSLVDRIRYTTSNDPTLLEAIADGSKLGDGIPLRAGTGPSDELLAYLDGLGGSAPAYIYGQASLAERGVSGYYDQATQAMFSFLMAKRTNNLSRSPTFKQFYWQRAEELAPFMDEASKLQLVDAARTAKLDDVADRMVKAKASGALTLEDADTIAKGFGLDRTRDLLYDMTERGQFFDAARLIFPFGEAWKEVATRWGKIALEQPQALRRGQQVIKGGRDADPDGDGNGFFYENANGEEVFAYPASGWISEKLFGVPVPLTGRISGLSLMTEVLPGVGPAVQFSAGALLPDKPEFDWARDLLFPFGELETKGGIVESLLPAWAKRWRESGLSPFARDEGAWNATVMDVSRWLASTGEYDTSDPDSVNRMLEDARSKARAVFVLRSAAQFFAPTAPTPEWIVQDKDGRVQVAELLVQEYQALSQDDFRTATDKMLDKFGENLFLLLQGKTAEVTPGAPVTKDGADWERSRSDVVERYPNVYGFFAPQGGDFDPSVYGRRLSTGDRVSLTPEQAVRLANDRVANAIYQKVKAEVGPRVSAPVQAGLRKLRAALVRDYPGYGDRSGIPEKASIDTLIADLTDAAGDERLEDNAITPALRTYLKARQMVAEGSEAQGLSPTGFRSAKRLAGVRAGLRALGAALVRETPDFAELWSRVFDRELAEEEDLVAV